MTHEDRKFNRALLNKWADETEKRVIENHNKYEAKKTRREEQQDLFLTILSMI